MIYRSRLLRLLPLFALFNIAAFASISVSVAPAFPQVKPGESVQLTATVSGTTNSVVIWSIAGAGCSGNACGQIRSDGIYVAPAVAPNPPIVSVIATSLADLTKSGTASVFIGTSFNVGVSVNPSSATLLVGEQQRFTATVTGTGNTAVSWSVSGAGCSGSTCGAVTSSGLYIAPPTAPSPAQVTVRATSVADPNKSASAVVTVTPPVGVTVSPLSAQVVTGTQRQLVATVTGTTNTSVTWALSGAGCSGQTCGSITSSGLYTAPSKIPTPPQVSVTATSVADATKSATATLTVIPPVVVTISPTSAQVITSSKQQFIVVVSGSANTSVTWTVAGSGCSGITCGSVSSAGLYTAPAKVPSPAVVNVKATSVADSTKSATAVVTIIPPVVVSVTPTTASVAVGGQQQFVATVTGTANTSVSWRVLGAGCSGAACGSITSAGLYTAPTALTNPAQVTVIATSMSDSSTSASAVVTIVAPVAITISPVTGQVVVGHNLQFASKVSGSSDANVVWSVTGSGCSGSACGTISSSGLYTAPNVQPNPAQVTVRVTSSADSTKSATAAVSILPAVAVSISPTTVQVPAGEQQQFQAVITGTSNTGATWTVAGSGCSGAACGTISTSGLYTAPTNIPNPALVTVTATSIGDATKHASAVVTIVLPTTVAVSPTLAIVPVNGQQQFRATVGQNSNKAVTWSVSGAGCSGTTCGTITSGGLFSAPANIPSPATVQIKAVSQADSSQTAAATVTIVASIDAKLTGHYAFLFKGTDSNGAYQAAGSFVADGAGHITSGLEDINRSAGPAKDISITGTYQVTKDNRASMTFNSELGSSTFKLALSLLGDKGRFMEFDESGVHGTGILERQDLTSFKTSAFSGSYVLGLSGQDVTGGHLGVLGVIYPNGSGFVSGGSLDVNDAGVVSPTFGSLSGAMNISSTGRGVVTMSIPGFDGGTFNFVLYVVSRSEFFLQSIDTLGANNPIFSGSAELQSGAPFQTSSFSGPSVFSLSGVKGTLPYDAVGRIVFKASQTLTSDYDQNVGGTIVTDGSFTGAYDVQLNGRGTLNLDNENVGQTRTWFLYAISPGKAFLMDVSTDSVAVGEMTPQHTTTPFANADIQGAYLFSSGEFVAPSTPLYTGIDTFDGTTGKLGAGSVSGTEDLSQNATLSLDQSVVGTYNVSPSKNNGRGTLSLTSPTAAQQSLWIVNSTEVLGLSIDPATTQPTIIYYEQ
jgi:hypothetical protein